MLLNPTLKSCTDLHKKDLVRGQILLCWRMLTWIGVYRQKYPDDRNPKKSLTRRLTVQTLLYCINKKVKKKL